MPLEYKTLKFRNDAEGLQLKDSALTALAAEGWHVVGESIEAGHMKGGQACCLATICLPMGFLSKRTPGGIVITLSREVAATATPNMPASGIGATEHAARGIGASVGYFLGRFVAKLRRRA